MDCQRIIMITGVTKGIGFALSKWFIDKGHIIIGCGRNVQVIQEMKTWASNSDFQPVDVSSAVDVETWINNSFEKVGVPDLIINNAAISTPLKPLWKTPLEDFNNLIDVNIKGVNNVIHFALPCLISAQKGIIVNMSSGWGRHTAAETAPYCCSKWGIEGLSLALAQELPVPLACVPLNPGTIDTEMLENYFGERARYSRSPEEWAKTAGPFLLALDRDSNGKQLTAP